MNFIVDSVIRWKLVLIVIEFAGCICFPNVFNARLLLNSLEFYPYKIAGDELSLLNSTTKEINADFKKISFNCCVTFNVLTGWFY